jgi:hypothetical protein
MGSQIFDSNELSVSAVKGVNTGTPAGAPPECVGVEGQSDLGVAIAGHSVSGFGVHGFSENNFGVRAVSTSGVGLRASTDSGSSAIEAIAGQTGNGLFGASDTGVGVRGTSRTNHAVHGESAAGRGVVGISQTFVGVTGESTSGTGVFGVSETGFGVHGQCKLNNSGVQGISVGGHGVHGESTTNHAVHGESAAGRGVVGISQTFVGVTGESTSSDGVFGVSATGIGVHGKGGHLAGFFEGSVVVTDDISLANGDCAEDFQIAVGSSAEPGTVMVLDDESSLRESAHAYDKRVAGVIAGAGSYKPGIVLDRQQGQGNRKPVALLGKVFCKADAQFGSIVVGDLLTTSPTPGYAMRADDPLKAFGAVIGKALRPLAAGQGLIPILVTLQ